MHPWQLMPSGVRLRLRSRACYFLIARLFRGLQIAVKRAGLDGLHRVRRHRQDMNVITLATFECPNIEALRTRRNPRQAHASTALRAIGSLN